MGWSEKDFCIKCDGGGKVLVCSNTSCPLGVHEKCLGFPARIDEMGQFYCPYCTYRQLVEESHQAQEKALSRKKALLIFLDGKVTSGDCQTEEFGNSYSKEPSHLPNARRIYDPRTENDENKPNKDNLPMDTLLEKGGQRQDGFPAECCKRVTNSQDSDVSSLRNDNDSLSRECDDVAGASDCNRRLVVVERRTVSGIVVACGEDYVGYEDEETAMRFQMVQFSNSIHLQPQQRNDLYQPHKTVENHLGDNHSVDSLVTENEGKESFPKAAKEGSDARTVTETIDSNEGTEEVQEQHVDKIAASSQGDLSLRLDLLEKTRLEAGGLICAEPEIVMNGKRSKYNDKSRESRDKSTDDNCSKRTSSAPRAYLDHLAKTTASSDSRQLPEPAASTIVFPNGRRKSLPWTDEEVNMLKEGVKKFSTDRKKNIPWRKILEYGRHVFDGTRTPVDLKDKWRNIVAKERDS